MTYIHEIGLSEAETTAIFSGNAERLFGAALPLAGRAP
jgi:hypothetical protein